MSHLGCGSSGSGAENNRSCPARDGGILHGLCKHRGKPQDPGSGWAHEEPLCTQAAGELTLPPTAASPGLGLTFFLLPFLVGIWGGRRIREKRKAGGKEITDPVKFQQLRFGGLLPLLVY